MDIYEENGVFISDEKKRTLGKFKDLLLSANEKINLTAIREEREIIIKHFCDSLKGSEYFPVGANVVEIGSGGGFPSLPLKIARDDLSFTLVEATGKKCRYLEETAKLLGLNGVKVINARAEDIGKDERYREKFHVATARAVARLSVLCEYCMPFVEKGGLFIAYKGDAEEEIKEAENAVNVLGGKIREVKEYSLSEGGEKRTIIVIEKVSKTPLKYPRGNGKERKNPL